MSVAWEESVNPTLANPSSSWQESNVAKRCTEGGRATKRRNQAGIKAIRDSLLSDCAWGECMGGGAVLA